MAKFNQELQLKEDGHSYGSNAYFYLSSDSDALIPHGDGIFGSHKLCCEDPLKRAIAAHKFLLGCLYDRAPDLLDTYMDEAMQVLADAVAYAQYYQMLPVVGTVLRQKYEALPDLSADVAIRSAFHALLAFKLESRVIFDEAFRHLVGGGNLHPGSSSLPTNTSNVDIEILILQNHHKLFEEVNGVLRQIQELTLSKRPVKSNSGKTIVGWEPTKFLQGLRPRKWEEKSRFLAQSVFNQWLSTESLKSTYNEVRMNERSSSDVLVMMRARRIFGRLIAADDAGDISMFGADVPKRLSDYFRIPGRSREAQTTHLAFQLEDLLRQAAEFARPIMSRPKGVKAMPPVPGKTSDHEATFDYFTHRSLPPEFYDDEFKKLDQNYTPLVEFTEASEEWIKVVGLEAVPEQVDVQEEGTMEDNGFHADLDDAPQADWEHEGDNGEEFVPDARDPLW